MTTASACQEFLSLHTIAVVGVSRSGRKYSNLAYNQLKARGYRVFPVNAQAETIGGDRCYPNLGALPEPVEGVLLFVPPEETERVVQEAAALGIRHIWMQPGAESQSAIRFCEDQGFCVVYNQCIMVTV